jgi:hypothetical protein
VAQVGDGEDSGPRLLFKGVGSGHTNATSAVASAVMVASRCTTVDDKAVGALVYAKPVDDKAVGAWQITTVVGL